MQQGNFIDVVLARHVSGTCRAKNTSIKLPCCIKLAFCIISWGRCTVKQPSLFKKYAKNIDENLFSCCTAFWKVDVKGFKQFLYKRLSIV